ncbi:unnamed protein product [Amoebophrya sp. A120]|nr:unnamed protein product [Amoebophrya sp. A120]|eukprot:GSA120T00010919001.1
MVGQTKRARGEAITVLDELVFEEEFGMDWRSGRARNIDFSSKKYNLESLRAGHGGGLLNKDLKKFAFVLADFSYNNLSEIDCVSEQNGFQNLLILKARHNCLIQVNLQLSTLKELNLAYNELVSLPSLMGVPNLEVLILAHNRIDGKFDTISAQCKRLKRLDLSSNQIQLNPTLLQAGILSLRRLPNLVTLKIKENPFCTVFPEYQVYMLKALGQLAALDDVKISPETRQEINSTPLLSMDRFDEIYDDRVKKQRQEEAAKKGDSLLLEFPCLMSLINLFREIVQHADKAQRCADQALLQCVALTDDLEAYGGKSFFSEIAQVPESIETFLQLANLLLERHDTIRSHVIQILARCSLVTTRRFGKKCVEALANCMKSDSTMHDDCAAAIENIIIPNITVESTMLHEAIAKLAYDIPIVAEKSLSPLVTDLGAWFIEDPGNEPIIEMLDACTRYRENAQTVLRAHGKALHKQMVTALDNKSLFGDLTKRRMWMGTVRFARNCIDNEADDDIYFVKVFRSTRGRIPLTVEERKKLLEEAEELHDDGGGAGGGGSGQKARGLGETLQYFKSVSLHVKLIARYRDSKGADGDIATMPGVDCKTAAEILKFLTTVMRKDVKILIDCATSYHVVKELCEIIRIQIADPYMLTEACNMLTLILYHNAVRMDYIRYVAESLSNVTPLLQYLGGKKYNQMYARIEKYRLEAMASSGSGGDSSADPYGGKLTKGPVMASLTSELMHSVFIAIVQLVEFFCTSPRDDYGNLDSTSEMIAQCFDRAQRETVLMSLLEVPSDELRISVMKCISKVPLSQLDLDETGKLIKVMSDTRVVGVGRTEYVLSMVISMLRIITCATPENSEPDDAVVGEAFRDHQAELAVAEVFDTLYRNSVRDTFGSEDEEDEKLQLSSHCLSFLVEASQFSSMRKFFRTKEAESLFLHVLKNEEAFHAGPRQDVCLEQTWCGRSLEFLLNAVSGQKGIQLDTQKKQCFRVVARIADVLEGRSDALRTISDPETPGISYVTLARREARMWGMEEGQHLPFLDADEWIDRAASAEAFVDAGGIDVLLQLLSDPGVTEREKYYRQLESEASTFKQEVYAYSKTQEEELARAIALRSANEEPTQLYYTPDDLGQNLEEGATASAGRKSLMTALMAIEDHHLADEDASAMFVFHPEEFVCNEHFFQDDTWKVNRSYLVAAVLRCLYMLAVVPVTDKLRFNVYAQLRSLDTMRRLLAILDSVPVLPCNCCAKLLRIIARVLTAVNEAKTENFKAVALPGENSKEDDQLILFDLVCHFLKRLGGNMLHLLRSTRSKFLSENEQALCSELASAVAVITTNVPYIKFSTIPMVQNNFIEKCIERVLPPVMIRVAVSMVLYDLQSTVHAVFASLLNGKKKHNHEVLLHRVLHHEDYNLLRRMATRVLSEHIARTPNAKYSILEAFVSAEVFANQSVRATYLKDLLTSVNMGVYRLFLERNMFPQERIYALCPVYFEETGTSVGLLCLTNVAIYALRIAEGLPAYHTANLGTEWTPAWELRAPRVTTVIWQKPYYSVVRIWTGPGEQYFGIGWRGDLAPRLADRPFTVVKSQEVHKTSTPAPRTQPGSGTVCICKNAGDRSEFVNAIQQLSGPEARRQALVLKHPQLMAEVHAKALAANNGGAAASSSNSGTSSFDEESAPVLCFSFAEREVKPGAYRQSFFLLTESVLKEYSFNWKKFQVPTAEEQDAQPEDVLSSNLQRTLLQQTSDDEDEDEFVKQRRERLVRTYPHKIKSHRARMHDHEESPRRNRLSPKDGNTASELLAEVDSFPLEGLAEVEFAAEEKCTLRLNLGGTNVVILFADDLAREAWREALNFVLRETATDKALG